MPGNTEDEPTQQHEPARGATTRRSIPGLRSIAAELRARNETLFAVALANAALVVLFSALLLVDGRTLLGRNVWTKPWKFAASIAVFTATVGWLLPSLELCEHFKRRVTAVISVTMLLEITLISVQAARVVPSHFNQSTPVDGAIFGIMGTAITINTLVVAVVLWRVVRSPPSLSPAYLWSVRLGLLVFVLASLEGWLMVANGGHAVGAPADAPGLPLLNWSLAGGDLRVAHFIGLHALQVLPLVGYLTARSGRLSGRTPLVAVGLAGLGYSALTGATFVQALLGVPLVASLPGASTLAVGGCVFAAPFVLASAVAPRKQ